MRKSVLLSLLLLLPAWLWAQDSFPEPQSRLRVIVDKTDIVFGESFRLTILYEVDETNQTSLRFEKAGDYVMEMARAVDQMGFIKNVQIDQVAGEQGTNAQGQPARQYRLYDALVKPDKTGVVEIPPFFIEIAQYQKTREEVFNFSPNTQKRLVPQYSEPISIDVLPNPLFPKATRPPLAGNFTFTDSIAAGPYSVGDTIDYTLTISGSSQGADFLLPQPAPDNYRVLTRRIDYTESPGQPDRPGFEKRYHLSLVPLERGKINLAHYFSWDYTPKGSQEGKQLGSTHQLKIRKKRRFKPASPDLDILLAVDVSESMYAEDYEPNRKGKAIELAEAYRTLFSEGRVLAFAGSTEDVSDRFSPELLDSIKIETRGTAMGNVVWLGTESLAASAHKRAIIIIGDGDNSVGNISTLQASFLAKDRGVKIYSIGIGHTGKVKFGQDYFGRTQYVDNTFSSFSLKQLATLTGGKYFYLDDYKSPAALMRAIKREITKQ